jgi:hypothetical protein
MCHLESNPNTAITSSPKKSLLSLRMIYDVRSGEDSLTEFKPQTAGRSDFKKTLVAFANSVPDCSGKHILAVMVGYSRERPHFSGAAYIRKGSESVRATPELYEDLINSRVDKCRKLIAYKGRLITVETSPAEGPFRIVETPLKSTRAEIIPVPLTKAQYEAIVLRCDAFCLLLQAKSSARKFSIGLTQLEIDYDVERERLMIRI